VLGSLAPDVRGWLDEPVTRLMLGTAQWGSGYGATNTVGRLSEEQVEQIIAVARRWGIVDIDTAHGYGDAEERLAPHALGFAVTTKVAGAGDVAEQVADSQRRIGLERLHAVLLHDWDALDSAHRQRAVSGLADLLESRVIARAGVSVYDADGVASAATVFASQGIPLGVVQVPANVLDRRLDDSADLTALHHDGAEVVVRSVFLQGLLLAPGGGRADHLDIVRFRESTLGAHPDASLVETCLAHAASLPWATHVVVGATTPAELDEIGAAWSRMVPAPADDALRSDDLALIDPRQW
jgi:aryl-alcohol dehydrogenase-like predicted oxidoreductase